MKNHPPKYEDEIVIGKISKSFGVKGELKVISLSDFPDRFERLKEVHLYSEEKNEYLVNENGDYEFSVESSEETPGFVKLKLNEVSNKDASDKLRGSLISIPLENRVEREKGEFYYYELIGCNVYDDNNTLLGRVKAVENYGGDDLLKIGLEGTEKEVYIPYRDEFIRKIDKEAKKIEVKLIDGLI